MMEAGEQMHLGFPDVPDMCLLGSSLSRAGEAWSTEWTDVTEELYDASKTMSKIATAETDPERNELYSLAAYELESIATIEGCISMGPPASVPNLIELRVIFSKIADSFEDPRSSESFRNAAVAIDGLVDDM